MLNKKIGRYEIKEIIGEGAMAVVYRAYDPEIDRSVACKVLKADHCVDEAYTSRFLRESKAAGALSHASIVTVYDVGEIDGAPYILMELIEGKDLGQLLKERGKFSQQETLNIALHLARALDYAHSANIVHRDIKPDNIILMPDNVSVKVADFGIARMNENEEAQQTQLGSVLGTPRYMSPEQALGEPIDGRSDLFSVGAIMYEMLTGKKAFDADNMSALMLQIAQKQPDPLKQIAPDVSAGLRQIIQKLLQKSPSKRFQTGKALADAIENERSEYQEQQSEQKKHKFIPLRYRWTFSAVVIVTLILGFSMKLMFDVQTGVMTKQVVEAGSSFAKFIAVQTASPMHNQNWSSLDELIQEAAKRDIFSYLIVTDTSNIIRAAKDKSAIGMPYNNEENSAWISRVEDVLATSTNRIQEHNVFNLETPVLYNDKEVGKIIVGISQQNLDELKQTTALFMQVVVGLTVLIVASVMFVLGGGITKPIRALNKTMDSLAAGNFDARISLRRFDELGKAFDNFNNMAAAIQSKYSDLSDELAFKEAKFTEWRVNYATRNLQPQTQETSIHEDMTIIATPKPTNPSN